MHIALAILGVVGGVFVGCSLTFAAIGWCVAPHGQKTEGAAIGAVWMAVAIVGLWDATVGARAREKRAVAAIEREKTRGE
jgi:hypothetical protein